MRTRSQYFIFKIWEWFGLIYQKQYSRIRNTENTLLVLISNLQTMKMQLQKFGLLFGDISFFLSIQLFFPLLSFGCKTVMLDVEPHMAMLAIRNVPVTMDSVECCGAFFSLVLTFLIIGVVGCGFVHRSSSK